METTYREGQGRDGGLRARQGLCGGLARRSRSDYDLSVRGSCGWCGVHHSENKIEITMCLPLFQALNL